MAADLTAFVLGYTGAVGKALVLELARGKGFKRIVLVGRREVKLPAEADDRFVQKLVNYDEIDKHADVFADCQVGFCCLGTTRATAGAENFVKVDRDYVLNTAAVAKEAGCSHFQLVSSTGANHKSSFLYPKTKGEVEERLKDVKFNRLSIFRPSMLIADREERRIGEKCIKIVLFPITKIFPTFISVPVETVAKAMIINAQSDSTEKVELLDNKTIHQMAK